jgi:hypothetical protein
MAFCNYVLVNNEKKCVSLHVGNIISLFNVVLTSKGSRYAKQHGSVQYISLGKIPYR